MDPCDLVKVWDAPDHTKLTPKQWSIRLPLQVAARINALCDLYPRRSKTEIIGDLLATALDQLIAALPTGPQDRSGADDLRGRFDRLAGRHLAELEGERATAGKERDR